VESRDRNGDFFTEQEIAAALTAADCDQALDTLMTAVHRHTGGHGHDDMALLLLEHGAYPHSSANGCPASGRAAAETAPPVDMQPHADDTHSTGTEQAHALTQAGHHDR